MDTKIGANALKAAPNTTAPVEASLPSAPDPSPRPQDPEGQGAVTPLGARAVAQADAVRSAQSAIQAGLSRISSQNLATAVPPLLERAAADLDPVALAGVAESLGQQLLGQPVDADVLGRLVDLVLDVSLAHPDQPEVLEALFRGVGRACAGGPDEALPPAFAGAVVKATGSVQDARAFHTAFFEALAQDVGLHEARRGGVTLIMGLALASAVFQAETDHKGAARHHRMADLMISQVLGAVAPLGPSPAGRIVGALVEILIDHHIVPAPGSGSADQGRLLAQVVDAVLEWPLPTCVAALVGVFSAITQSPWSARARNAETEQLASRLARAAARTPGRDLTALSGVGQDPLCAVFLDGLKDGEREALYAIACERCVIPDSSMAGRQLTRLLELDATPSLQAALLGSLVRYGGLDLTPAMARHVSPRLVAHMAAAAAAGGAGGSLSIDAALAEVEAHSAYLGEMYHWLEVGSGLGHLLRGGPGAAAPADADKELVLEQARFCRREYLALTGPGLPAVVRQHLAPVASRLAAFNNALLRSLGVSAAQGQVLPTSSRSPSSPSPG